MSTVILDGNVTAHSGSSADTATGFRSTGKTFPSNAEAASGRIVAATPPFSQDQCDRLATIVGGGA